MTTTVLTTVVTPVEAGTAAQRHGKLVRLRRAGLDEVPTGGHRPELADDRPVRRYLEALALGVPARPVLLGPVSFLSRTGSLGRLAQVLPVYRELLGRLHEAGARHVQLDEPALSWRLNAVEFKAVTRAYDFLAEPVELPELWLQVRGGFPTPSALTILSGLPVRTIGLDFTGAGTDALPEVISQLWLRGRRLAAGLLAGHSEPRRALATASVLSGLVAELVVTSGAAQVSGLLGLARELRAGAGAFGRPRAVLEEVP